MASTSKPETAGSNSRNATDCPFARLDALMSQLMPDDILPVFSQRSKDLFDADNEDKGKGKCIERASSTGSATGADNASVVTLDAPSPSSKSAPRLIHETHICEGLGVQIIRIVVSKPEHSRKDRDEKARNESEVKEKGRASSDSNDMDETTESFRAFTSSLLDELARSGSPEDVNSGVRWEMLNPFQILANDEEGMKFSTARDMGGDEIAEVAERFLRVRELLTHARPRPPTPRPRAPSLYTYPGTDDKCAVCQESISGTKIKLECGHHYDIECLKAMFSANVDDEHSFPPRCCSYVVPLEHVQSSISPETAELYRQKMVEYGTAFRLYCANVECNNFLGARSRRATPIQCSKCSAETCSKCTSAAHPNRKRCKLDKGLRKALQLGQAAGWQRCPSCRALVERNQGCFHMSCRCGTQFCYLCAADWRVCACSNRTPMLLARLVIRRLKLRGNYLLDGEMPRAGIPGSGAVKKAAGMTWKGVVSAVNVVRAPLRRSA